MYSQASCPGLPFIFYLLIHMSLIPFLKRLYGLVKLQIVSW